MAGGAIGNIIDRVRFGYVVDFRGLLRPRLPLGVQLKDAAITFGATLLVLDFVVSAERKPGTETGAHRTGA